jgi:hypothetical protein
MVEIRNANPRDIRAALEKINRERYNGNVCFKKEENRITRAGWRSTITLTVHDSRGPGHRRGLSSPDHLGHYLRAACWHVYGHFFDAVLEICPQAVIISRWNGRKVINKDGGNWEDTVLGSLFHPVCMSDLCDCEEGGL